MWGNEERGRNPLQVSKLLVLQYFCSCFTKRYFGIIFPCCVFKTKTTKKQAF